MANRVLIAFLVIAVFVLSYGWLRCMSDDVEALIDNTPAAAPACSKLVNPCQTVDCNRPDTRRIT